MAWPNIASNACCSDNVITSSIAWEMVICNKNPKTATFSLIWYSYSTIVLWGAQKLSQIRILRLENDHKCVAHQEHIPRSCVFSVLPLGIFGPYRRWIGFPWRDNFVMIMINPVVQELVSGVSPHDLKPTQHCLHACKAFVNYQPAHPFLGGLLPRHRCVRFENFSGEHFCGRPVTVYMIL